jgi:hypothetical protein
MASGGAAARMDPEAATELVRKGSILLLLDIPQHTLFGIDTQVCAVLDIDLLGNPPPPLDFETNTCFHV